MPAFLPHEMNTVCSLSWERLQLLLGNYFELELVSQYEPKFIIFYQSSFLGLCGEGIPVTNATYVI